MHDRAEPGSAPIRAAQAIIGPEEIDAALRVLRSGMVVQGPEVAAFEEEFALLVRGRHCVAVNSGTSALHLSLMALGIGPGDEVVVPSFSFAASANAVRLVGAEPVFADIDAATYCLDPAAAAAAIGPRTAAIVPVHLFGHPAAMGPIMELAERHALAVVEDAAQAHAATLYGTPVGVFGSVGCFSFYPTKNMHTLEGGMITTADPALARTLRLLRNQGMEARHAVEIVGANLRMTDVSAAIGRVQLAGLPERTARRRANAAVLSAGITAVATPTAAEGAGHVYNQYTVRIGGDRDAAQQRLFARGVDSSVYYRTPIHRLKAYAGRAVGPSPGPDLRRTEQAAAEVLSLPVHPLLTPADLERIVDAVNSLGRER